MKTSINFYSNILISIYFHLRSQGLKHTKARLSTVNLLYFRIHFGIFQSDESKEICIKTSQHKKFLADL